LEREARAAESVETPPQAHPTSEIQRGAIGGRVLIGS
jgi:hypothetical protein